MREMLLYVDYTAAKNFTAAVSEKPHLCPLFRTKGPSIYYVIQIWGPKRPPK